MNTTVERIVARFPYLSVDVRTPDRDDHPQVMFKEFNAVDDVRAGAFAAELAATAERWAASGGARADAAFAKALDGLRPMLKSISATSLFMEYGGELLVERPGFEVAKTRRGDLSGFVDRVTTDWSFATDAERLAVSQLALLGIAPLQMELVNYLPVSKVPHVIGRMLSRLEGVIARCPLEALPSIVGDAAGIMDRRAHTGQGLKGIEALQDFFGIEQRALAHAGLVRTTVPGGTRPRVYVPNEAMGVQEAARVAALEVLERGSSRKESIASFLGLMWRDFADEAFVVLHDGGEVNAIALVGGCIYDYRAHVDESGPVPKLVNDGKPVFIATAGAYVATEWRRNMASLGFEGGTPALEKVRRDVIEGEALPEALRSEEGRNGRIADTAQKLLGRQINYNMSNVLGGRMERISADEWSPFMCRDQFGVVYNPGHALAGVGEMFRGLLAYGGRFSQLRCWRERDGTHGFRDMRKFLGYKRALDQFLSKPGLGG